MKELYEIEGENTKARLTPTLQALVEAGSLTRPQAVKIMQEEGAQSSVLLEG